MIRGKFARDPQFKDRFLRRVTQEEYDYYFDWSVIDIVFHPAILRRDTQKEDDYYFGWSVTDIVFYPAITN
jgi:hypothetical protein